MLRTCRNNYCTATLPYECPAWTFATRDECKQDYLYVWLKFLPKSRNMTQLFLFSQLDKYAGLWSSKADVIFSGWRSNWWLHFEPIACIETRASAGKAHTFATNYSVAWRHLVSAITRTTTTCESFLFTFHFLPLTLYSLLFVSCPSSNPLSCVFHLLTLVQGAWHQHPWCASCLEVLRSIKFSSMYALFRFVILLHKHQVLERCCQGQLSSSITTMSLLCPSGKRKVTLGSLFQFVVNDAHDVKMSCARCIISGLLML